MNINDRPARLVASIPIANTHKDAVLMAGYSQKTAEKQPKRTIETALNTLAERAIQGNHEATQILQNVGVSREEVEKLYKELAFLSKNDNVRLQAGKPLFTHVLGLKWDNEQAPPAPPPINIGIVNTRETAPAQEIAPPVSAPFVENVTDSGTEHA